MKGECRKISTNEDENCLVQNIILELNIIPPVEADCLDVIPACRESFLNYQKDFGQAEMTEKCRGIFK
jgi:hypothetical protein